MKSIKTSILGFLFCLTFSVIQAQETPTTTIKETKTTTVKVKGVGCVNDLRTIANNVEKETGVTSCKAIKKGATSVFEVIYDPSVIEESTFHKTIENTPGCSNPEARPYKVKK